MRSIAPPTRHPQRQHQATGRFLPRSINQSRVLYLSAFLRLPNRPLALETPSSIAFSALSAAPWADRFLCWGGGSVVLVV